jgi:hypothetical protein
MGGVILEMFLPNSVLKVHMLTKAAYLVSSWPISSNITLLHLKIILQHLAGRNWLLASLMCRPTCNTVRNFPYNFIFFKKFFKSSHYIFRPILSSLSSSMKTPNDCHIVRNT